MEKYKYIIDILSSIVAFIAIFTVLLSWYKSSRKPLNVERVIIHRGSTKSTYILIIKNRK